MPPYYIGNFIKFKIAPKKETVCCISQLHQYCQRAFYIHHYFPNQITYLLFIIEDGEVLNVILISNP